MLRELEALDVSSCTAAARQAYAEHTRYFQNQKHRMDYPRYVANGWQIGSGPVESACKTIVVGNRLKARWYAVGRGRLRTPSAISGQQYLSEPGQWETFWRDHPN